MTGKKPASPPPLSPSSSSASIASANPSTLLGALDMDGILQNHFTIKDL